MPYPEKPTDLPLLLKVPDLQSLWGVGRTTAYQRTQDPTFPEPLAFSGYSYRWWRDEILEWMETQRASRKARPVRPSTHVLAPRLDALPAPRPVKKRKRAA